MKKPYLSLVILALILTACSSTGPLSSSKASGPTGVLLAQAKEHENMGNIEQSVALVERALRIEPRNAFAWHRLAKLQFTLGNFKKAEQFAKRSIQFAAGNKRLINENEKLIENVRRKLERGVSLIGLVFPADLNKFV